MVLQRPLIPGCLLLLLLLLFLSNPSLARERVGVLDFDGNVREEYRTAASNRLSRILMDLERFDVIERREMDRILSEQHFQLTGLVDVDTAVEVGKILGITQAFVGSIDHLSSSWDQGNYRAESRVTVKIIDVETSTLLYIMENSGSGFDRNSTTARHQALENALGEGFVNQLRERFAITSIITRVEGSLVYLMGGQDIGMKNGYRYRILRPDEPGRDFQDTFYQEVGLLEIIDVSASRSRGRIIYAAEPVQQQDVAQEVPYNTRGLMGFRLQTLRYQLADGEVTGVAPLVEFVYATERPFGYQWGLSLGFSTLPEMLFINIGLEGSLELPILPGHFYITAGGGGGLYGALQDHTHWASGPASASSFYILGNGGIKAYLDYDRGIRINMGIAGRYGGDLSSWESEKGRNLSDYVPYRKVNANGVSLLASLSIPLDLGFFK